MTNYIEHFTAPGKYYVDKFFDEVNKIVRTQKEINNPKTLKELQIQNYQLKQNYNRMQNK
ncbi:hypothetical protein HYS72_03335 [Candidatus Pacearchaeota archaeon]|nr:hypothetical protein [Candidatus Pacearchaeota archaeon]MBI2056889.1 hypothetical protein [Candidatus Pacearchaeota archaeon]